MAEKTGALELLKRVPAFAGLADDDLSHLSQVAISRHYLAGSRIFAEGDRGDTCYLIESGSARVTRQHRDGRVITLASLVPGDIFGELAMFDGEVRSASVEAIDELYVLALIGDDVRLLLAKKPEVTVKLLAGLARRLRVANERITRQSFQGVAGRVAKALLDLAEHIPHGGPVTIHITQTDVAQLAGTSRESVSRFLSTLEQASVVHRGRGKITILDRVALERYVY